MQDPPPSETSSVLERNAPPSWRNWHASDEEKTIYGVSEFPLYSDAWFMSELHDKGPYAVLNALPRTTHSGGMHEWKPALVLRVWYFLRGERPDMSVTSKKHYHGGWIADEVAALLSLELGLRIVAGPESREYSGESDFGRPRAHAAGLLPNLPPRAGRPQIASLFDSRSLEEVKLFETLPTLSLSAATALIKSARSYQQALWIADTTPETAWLLLVSAVEIAAGYWDGDRMTSVEKLERSKANLFAFLRDKSDPDLLERVAEELHPLIGAMGKFVSFCVTFKPEPPASRPTFEKVDFANRAFKDAITTIYNHRSDALHDGVPFPAPMCEPPQQYSLDEPPAECPGGLGAASHGASWVGKDCPMHLHIFAHIVRGALLNWWNTLVPQPG